MTPTPLLPDPHQHAAEQVAVHLGVEPAHGLAAPEVNQRLQQHGPNRLRPVQGLHDPGAAGRAVLSGLIGDLVDTLSSW
jgi:hypothetical protein